MNQFHNYNDNADLLLSKQLLLISLIRHDL